VGHCFDLDGWKFAYGVPVRCAACGCPGVCSRCCWGVRRGRACLRGASCSLLGFHAGERCMCVWLTARAGMGSVLMRVSLVRMAECVQPTVQGSVPGAAGQGPPGFEACRITARPVELRREIAGTVSSRHDAQAAARPGVGGDSGGLDKYSHQRSSKGHTADLCQPLPPVLMCELDMCCTARMTLNGRA